MPKPDGRSKPRPGIDEQRRIIVDAAIEVFAVKGARATSVSDICTAADVSRHTFYRCFRDKDDMVAYIYDLAADQPVQQVILEGLPESQDVEAWKTVAIDRMVDAVLENSAMAQFLFVEYGDPGSEAHRIINAAFTRYAGTLEAWLGPGAQSPGTALFLKSIMVSAQWILLDAIRRDLTPAAVAEAKEALQHVATGALTTLSPPSP